MRPRLSRFNLRKWLDWVREHLRFAGRRGGPGLAGVRQPRRPRPPTRPPMAQAAEPEGEAWPGSSVATLKRAGWRRWWRRHPRAEHA